MKAWLTKFQNESIEAFLQRCVPSQTSALVPWISVNDDTRYNTNMSVHERLDEAVEQGQIILDQLELDLSMIGAKKGALRKQAHANLLGIAAKYQQTCGKWMLMPTGQHVDEIWRQVATATCQGELGCSSKVSTGNQSERSVICIYFDPFYNVDKITQSLATLRRLGVTWLLSYKIDLFTTLDIYSANKWGLAPSAFSSRTIETSEVVDLLNMLRLEYGNVAKPIVERDANANEVIVITESEDERAANANEVISITYSDDDDDEEDDNEDYDDDELLQPKKTHTK